MMEEECTAELGQERQQQQLQQQHEEQPHPQQTQQLQGHPEQEQPSEWMSADEPEQRPDTAVKQEQLDDKEDASGDSGLHPDHGDGDSHGDEAAAAAASAGDSGLADRFTLEAVAKGLMALMATELLQLRLLQEWVIFSREDFDFHFGSDEPEDEGLPQEPYQVLSVLFHLPSGRYIVRVWHRTFRKGLISELSDLEEVLWDVFHGTVPCLGVEERLLEVTFDTTELPITPCSSSKKSWSKKRVVAQECELLVRQEELSQEELQAEVRAATCFRCRSLLPEDAIVEEDRKRIALLNKVEVAIQEDPNMLTKEENLGEAAPKRRKAVGGAQLAGNNQCKYCLELFSSNQTRYLHERDVHLSGRFNCQVCGRYCSNIPELLDHFKSSHTDAALEELKCPICESNGFGEAFIEHYKDCLQNKKTAVAKGEYKRRRKAGSEVIKCHYCNKTFRKKCDLTNHYRSHNGEKLTCPECDFQSHSIHTIYTHRKSHARARGEEKVSHFCDHCGQNFTTRNYLQKHVRYAHQRLSDDIKCEFCGEVFERQHTYNRHKNKEHSDDPRFACSECGARFGSESEVKKHSWSHSDQPRLFCDLCGKGLKTQKSMKAHMRAHRGEKPYKCNLCDYCCVSSSALSLHKRFKHRGGEPMAVSKANGRA